MCNRERSPQDGHPAEAAQSARVFNRGKKQKLFSGLLDNTQVILLDGTDGELGGMVRGVKERTGTVTHNFRGVHPSSHNLQPHFCVLLDNLETIV